MAHRTLLIDGEKSIELDNLQRWEQLGNVPWRDESTGVHRYYAAVPFVYRGVEIRANTLSGLPWAILRGETDLWTSEDPSPPPELAMLGELPDWLWCIEAALCLTATAYLYKQRNRVRITGLRWLDPTLIQPTLDFHEGIIGWQRSLMMGAADIPLQLAVDDVVAVWLKGLAELSPRVPPAQAAMAVAGASYNLQAFVARFFQRGAIKATLLTVPQGTGKPEREKLKAWWERVMAGIRNAFGAEVVSADVKPVVIGEGLKELSNTELTTSQREEIATAFGIPHSMMLSNAANFATSVQDETNFYNTTIIPEARLIQRQLNRQLFEPMGYRFEFRPNELSVFQEDEKNRSAAVEGYVRAGMKLSVAAEILGVDMPAGMKYTDLDPEEPEPTPVVPPTSNMPVLNQTVPPGQEATPDPERQAEIRRFRAWAKRRAHPDPAKFASDLLSDADKRAFLDELPGAATAQYPFRTWHGTGIPEHIKALVLQLDPDDDEAEQQARMEIERRAERALAQALARVLADATPGNDDDVPRLVDQIDRELRQGRTVRDVLERMLLESADLGVSMAIAQAEAIGFGFDWTLANLHARDWAAQHAGRLIGQISDTTRRMVQQATARWIENGEPLARLVQDLEGTFGRPRARLIASTEVTNVVTEGNLLAWREAGFGETEPNPKPALHPGCRCWIVVRINDDGSADYIWMTAHDERVCPQCGPLHGRVVGIARARGTNAD